jgi:hypothetical protein
MWKLIRSLNLNNAPKESKWATGEAEHFIAQAEYDFGNAMSDRELQLKKGQNIRLAPASHQPPHVQGWVLASDGKRIGLVPTNYIKILGKRSANPVPIRTTNLINNNNIDYSPFSEQTSNSTSTACGSSSLPLPTTNFKPETEAEPKSQPSTPPNGCLKHSESEGTSKTVRFKEPDPED